MHAFKVQEIKVGKERAVVVPIETWQRLMELLEEIEDEYLYDEAKADTSQDTISHEELCRRLGRSPLRYLRTRVGMSQTQLARKAGLSQSFVAKLEANEKSMSDASRRKIARALGIQVSDLK
jgi:DNA-binding XRE family transcriptional regulator